MAMVSLAKGGKTKWRPQVATQLSAEEAGVQAKPAKTAMRANKAQQFTKGREWDRWRKKPELLWNWKGQCNTVDGPSVGGQRKENNTSWDASNAHSNNGETDEHLRTSEICIL